MIVIQAPNGMRAIVHPDSLHEWLLRGFTALGPPAEGAPGLLTVAEWADEQAARDAAVKAATSPDRKVKTTNPQLPKEG